MNPAGSESVFFRSDGYLPARAAWESLGVVALTLFPRRAAGFGSGVGDCAGIGLRQVRLSLSDKAKSCFIISAFSALFAFAGPLANSLMAVAHTISAVAPPIS